MTEGENGMDRNDAPELHTLQPLVRFSERAEDYAQYRPGYPTAAIAQVLDGLGDPTTLTVADIGAGTGISARLLAAMGATVWAVEPNAAMHQAAMPHPAVRWQAGTAEATGLAPATVDLVACFQAFHWFDPARCLPEFRRVVKPSGRLAVVWNDRDRADPFTQGYSQIVQRLSQHHPAEQRLVADRPLWANAYFGPGQQWQFPYRQPLTLAGLIGRAKSVSYVPTDGRSLAELHSALTALHHQWADGQGLVYLAYTTRVLCFRPR